MVREYHEIPRWKNIAGDQWNDWRWQLANRLTTVKDLGEVISMSPEVEIVFTRG